MDILVPKNLFLRVADKFVPAFIDNDKAVRISPSLLYKKLFAECVETGSCTLSQKYLADQCKFSIRCLQYAQKRLKDLGYIHINHVPGECSTYVLLLSDRIKNFLSSSDLIDRSSWYPRPNTATPPQNLQDGCANTAPSSYNVDKSNKNSPITPLSETPSMSAASDVPPDAAQTHGRGDSFPVSSKNYATMLQAFERLWAIWPVKQARHGALRVFCALARSGRLPSLAALLAAIQNMSANDDRWQRGYTPNLVNWLKDQRWNDEPIRRSSTHAEPAAPSARPDAKKEHKVFPPLPASAPLPELSPAMENTVQNLCSLWSAPSHTPVRAFFRSLLARKNNLDTSALLTAARTHLAEAGASSGPLLRWLMAQQWDQRSCAA